KDQIGGEDLRVEGGYCQIKPRQRHRQKCRQIPDKAEKRDHREVSVVVVTCLKESVEGRGEDQSLRGVVHHDNDSSLQNRGCCLVRTLGGLVLGERRIPLLLRELFQDAAVQDPIPGNLL